MTRDLMSSRTAKKLILVVCLLALVPACHPAPLPDAAQGEPSQSKRKSPRRPIPATSETYGPPVKLADLEEQSVAESSGLAASRNSPGVYWTHNDSDNGPFIYAFDEKGARRGVWRVNGATSRDWEDMAAGPGPNRDVSYLYIGDTGDNMGKRTEIIVYRIPEPAIDPSSATSTKLKPLITEPAEAIRLRYPEGAHDAEALLVHPVSGKIYVVTKVAFENPLVYEADSMQLTDSSISFNRLGELNINSLFGGIITGGAISPDGQRVALCDLFQGYEFVLPKANANFNEIWKQPLTTVWLGKRKQGEAITYRLDGKALLATSEGRPTPLIQVVRK
jgi:hypothetical protein